MVNVGGFHIYGVQKSFIDLGNVFSYQSKNIVHGDDYSDLWFAPFVYRAVFESKLC